MSVGVVYTMERHDELLHLWREQNASALRIVHLDFHCDMRGMLVDRRAGRAYRIRDRFAALDQGNFLAHAVEERRIDGIRWVHDEPGGREHDIGTVKFESDLTAVPHRVALALRREEGIPIDYEVVSSRRWTGVRSGESLDIDWDYIACLDYAPESIPARIDAFWHQMTSVIPEQTYICYSPEYSHPTRELFDQFVSNLGDRFGATVIHRDPVGSSRPPNQRSIRGYVPAPVYRLARAGYHRSSFALKKRGIF